MNIKETFETLNKAPVNLPILFLRAEKAQEILLGDSRAIIQADAYSQIESRAILSLTDAGIPDRKAAAIFEQLVVNEDNIVVLNLKEALGLVKDEAAVPNIAPASTSPVENMLGLFPQSQHGEIRLHINLFNNALDKLKDTDNPECIEEFRAALNESEEALFGIITEHHGSFVTSEQESTYEQCIDPSFVIALKSYIQQQHDNAQQHSATVTPIR